MILHNNYLQVCQCDICQAESFDTCGGAKELKSPGMPGTTITVTSSAWTNTDKEGPAWLVWSND